MSAPVDVLCAGCSNEAGRDGLCEICRAEVGAVDVLAELDRWIEGICRAGGTPYDAMEARAAVAELIESVRNYEIEMTNPVPCHVMRRQTRIAMFAALARVMGAS